MNNELNFESGLWFKKPRPECQFCLNCDTCNIEFNTYFGLFSQLDYWLELIHEPNIMNSMNYEGTFVFM
jgi:hypothetical protein